MCLKIPEHEHKTEDLSLWCGQRLVKLHTEEPHFCFQFILTTPSSGNNESVYTNCDIIPTNIASDVSRLGASRYPPHFQGGAPLCQLFALTFNESFIKLMAVYNLANIKKHPSLLRRLPNERHSNFYLTEQLSNQWCLSFHFLSSVGN